MHVAARVGADARAGEILVSRDTRADAGPDFVAEASRVVALKGVGRDGAGRAALGLTDPARSLRW